MSTTTRFDDVVTAHTREASLTPDGTWTISLSQDYDYPLDEVWNCWTDPQRLARWFGTLHGPAELGAPVEMTMPPPEVATQTLVLRACEPPRRLLVDWGGFGEGPSQVEVVLEPVTQERTRVLVRHSGLADRAAWAYGAGWGEVMHLAGLAVADRGFELARIDYDRTELEEHLHRFWDDLVPQGRSGGAA